VSVKNAIITALLLVPGAFADYLIIFGYSRRF
jgi:hypothetical protein